jgi:hypothetical protein
MSTNFQPPRGGAGVPANYDQPNGVGGADPFSRVQAIADAFERRQKQERYQRTEQQFAGTVRGTVMAADGYAARQGGVYPAQLRSVLENMRLEDIERSKVLRRESLLPLIDGALARIGRPTAPAPAPVPDTARILADQKHADGQAAKLLASLVGLEKPKVTNMQTGQANGVTVPQRSQDTVGQVKAEIIRIGVGCSEAFLRAQLEERGVAVPQGRVEKPTGIAWQIPSVDILRWAYTMVR